RMEFLKQNPVADDVLDAVGHHRQHVGAELDAEAGIAKRREGPSCGRCTAAGARVVHWKGSMCRAAGLMARASARRHRPAARRARDGVASVTWVPVIASESEAIAHREIMHLRVEIASLSLAMTGASIARMRREAPTSGDGIPACRFAHAGYRILRTRSR